MTHPPVASRVVPTPAPKRVVLQSALELDTQNGV
jgi:hypothetical protein